MNTVLILLRVSISSTGRVATLGQLDHCTGPTCTGVDVHVRSTDLLDGRTTTVPRIYSVAEI